MKKANVADKQSYSYIPPSYLFILWVLTKIGEGALLLIKISFILIKLIFRLIFNLLHLLLKTILRLFQIAPKLLAYLKKLGKVKIPLPALRKPHLRLPFPAPERKPVSPPKLKTEIIFILPFRLKVRYFFFGFLVAFLFLFLPAVFYFWVKELPSPYLLSSREIPQTTKIYDREDVLLYEIYAEQNRTIVPLAEIPESLKEATVAIEDKDFYRHQGFNPRSILRAAKENLLNHKLQGGSTISQQLIKSALLTPEVTLKRKAKELVLAFWAERIYSKDQILEMYLNQVPYGGTAWGVEAAAQTYFGKPVKDLTLAQSALLAGLPAAPTLYSPFGAHPELARERQGEVLRKMVEEDYLTPEEAQQAKEEELNFTPQTTNIKAPHFVMYIKEQLVKKYGERMVERGGLEITTTLDLELQEKVQEIVRNEVESLKNLQVGNGAALITDPQTGEILAMVGSKDYFAKDYDGNVNVTLSLRQPGSAIKVVNYATALQNGFTLATILDDSPATYQTPGSPPYSPVNYDGLFHGKLPLRYALGNSYNVPAVKVLAKIGVEKMLEMGREMGITSWEDGSRFGLSLTLGGGDVTMFDMAKVYGTLANQGKRVDLNPVLAIKDNRGEILEKNQIPHTKQVLPEGVAFLLSHTLADNSARSAAFGPQSVLFIPGYTVSVKTGTTNEKRDNWTIGYSPSFAVVVWVGNNDNSPMRPALTSGITGAAPIWRKVTDILLEGKPDEPLQKPGDVVELKICSVNGLLPCSGCPEKMEYFLKGTEPKNACQPSPSPSPEELGPS